MLPRHKPRTGLQQTRCRDGPRTHRCLESAAAPQGLRVCNRPDASQPDAVPRTAPQSSYGPRASRARRNVGHCKARLARSADERVSTPRVRKARCTARTRNLSFQFYAQAHAQLQKVRNVIIRQGRRSGNVMCFVPGCFVNLNCYFHKKHHLPEPPWDCS